ncbi:MAG: site-specific DNA-methyltransferase [Spirochaetales bacterium]|nr:site-specific DNA-methyltransferase [Spirochaetales bacterium]
MEHFPLPRLEKTTPAREIILPLCRLSPGDVWTDPVSGHRVGCLDAADTRHIDTLMNNNKAACAIHDPPYNLVAFQEQSVEAFLEWCSRWIDNTNNVLDDDGSLYIWLGADQNDGFQPFPDFMIMMREKKSFKSRSFITMRNQRGYGTQKNWMAIRQELLYYTKGNPGFNIDAEYTDIPKILKGYYKEVGGVITENTERSKSDCIRAGNVWVDIQQVFYRMQENVNGCYAQKPLQSIERIISASSQPEDIVIDFFTHAGTTLIACEKMKRVCFTADIDPVFCEITIRRLEHLQGTGKTGWQNSNPFAEELISMGITGFDEKGNPIHGKPDLRQQSLW